MNAVKYMIFHATPQMLLYSYLIAFGHFPKFEVFHHLFNVISSALEERSQPCLNNLRSGFHHSSDQCKTIRRKMTAVLVNCLL